MYAVVEFGRIKDESPEELTDVRFTDIGSLASFSV